MNMLFDSAQQCCENHFPAGCETMQECDSPADADDAGSVPDGRLRLEAGQVVSGDGIPWDAGNPPRWQPDEGVVFEGAGSLGSVPGQDPGSAGDLTLKINVPGMAMLRCWARIDVSQPFDSFGVVVDGAMRNQFQSPVRGWMEIFTTIPNGDHTVVFRVQYFEPPPGLDRLQSEMFGSGRVWLANCEITEVS